MKIGIDIDEVIMDTLKEVNNFYNKKNKSTHKIEDYLSYDWWDVWKTTKEEAIMIWHEFNNLGHHDKIHPIEDAPNSLKNLSKENELIFITSRNRSLKEETIKWFLENLSLKNPKIFFTSNFYPTDSAKTKKEVCQELGISLMIEDHEKYSLEMAESGIKVILFDKPWNKKVSHKNIIRISNWNEALNEIALIRKELHP